GRILRTQLVGEKRRGRGEHHVRRDGRDDQQIDVRAVATGLLERLPRRRQRQIRKRLRFASYPAFADARALHDPLVRGVDHLCEVVVRDHALGRVGAQPGNGYVEVAAPVADHPLSLPTKTVSTASTATSPSTLALPCPLAIGPRTRRNSHSS